jgi:hypothetical protein
MTPMRLAIAGLTVVALTALIGWQLRRDQIVRACLDSGGEWHGRLSTCNPPLRPILRRDLERS